MPILRTLIAWLIVALALSSLPPSPTGLSQKRAPPARKLVRPVQSPSAPLSFDARQLLAGNWTGSARHPPARNATTGVAATDDDMGPVQLDPPQSCSLSLAVSPGAAADKPLSGVLACGHDKLAWRVEFLSASGERGSILEQAPASSVPAGRKAKWGKICEFSWDDAGAGAASSAVRSSGAGSAVRGAGAAVWCFLSVTGARANASSAGAGARVALVLDVRDAATGAPLLTIALERVPTASSPATWAQRYGTYALVAGLVVLQVVLKGLGITRRIGAGSLPPARSPGAAVTRSRLPAVRVDELPSAPATAAPAPAPAAVAAPEEKKDR